MNNIHLLYLQTVFSPFSSSTHFYAVCRGKVRRVHTVACVSVGIRQEGRQVEWITQMNKVQFCIYKIKWLMIQRLQLTKEPWIPITNGLWVQSCVTNHNNLLMRCYNILGPILISRGWRGWWPVLMANMISDFDVYVIL